MKNIVSNLEIMVGGWVGSFSLILFFMHSVSWLSVMVGRNPSQAMSKGKRSNFRRTCERTYLCKHIFGRTNIHAWVLSPPIWYAQLLIQAVSIEI